MSFCQPPDNLVCKDNKSFVVHIWAVYYCADTENGSICSMYASQKIESPVESDTKGILISSLFKEEDRTRQRLNALITTLDWLPDSNIKYDVHFRCNDVFIVNTLREWLQPWKKDNFQIGPEKIPHSNSDLLYKISDRINKINLYCYWINEKDPVLLPLTSLAEKDL